MEVISILSICAIATTFGLFLCGIPICQTIARKGSTEGITSAPFLLGTIGCVFWLRYGFLKGDNSVKLINAVGAVFQISYLAFYYVYTQPKTTITRSIAGVVGLIAAMTAYVGWRAATLPGLALQHLGLLCMTFNILNFGAPLAGLKDVVASRSTENLPLPLCFANLLVSAQWFWYGTLTGDPYIKIPNFIGIILAILQLSLFLIYPRRATTSRKID